MKRRKQKTFVILIALRLPNGEKSMKNHIKMNCQQNQREDLLMILLLAVHQDHVEYKFAKRKRRNAQDATIVIAWPKHGISVLLRVVQQDVIQGGWYLMVNIMTV